MTGPELVDFLRSVILRDTTAPLLWADGTLYRYLSEAQEMHARKTYSIVSDTNTITTVIGTPSYALPAGAVFVLSARVSTNSRDLLDYTRKVIPSHLLTSTGEPQIFTLDEATGKIRFYPVPDAVFTINTRMAMLPAGDISNTVLPEIMARWHMDLLSFAAWRCLQGNDVDGQSTKAADRHEKEWNQKLLDAKREIYRMNLGANPSIIRSWTGKRN